LPPKRPRIRPAASIAVADLVTVPGEAHNLIGRYDPRAAGLPRGGALIEGVVCSIREIATGRLVAKTKGPLERYVIELVHDLTFSPQFSSARGSAPLREGALERTGVLSIGSGKAPTEVVKNPMWLRLRSLLRAMAESNQLVSVASGGLAGDSFRQLLDGWRVVKVKAEVLTRQE
jgi:hypothetical protein